MSKSCRFPRFGDFPHPRSVGPVDRGLRPRHVEEVTNWGSGDPVRVGNDLQYTVRVLDTGAMQATGIVMTDVLPNSVVFEALSTKSGTCTVPDGMSTGGTITCDLGTLPPGGIATIKILVGTTAGDGAQIINFASVTADQERTIPRTTPPS
jgi:uncharacterized repeat protein (TIGR01451 family)